MLCVCVLFFFSVVVGAKEVLIASPEELLSLLEMGNALRHTDATGMNEHSSRSHTILTLQVNLCCQSNNSSSKTVRSSKIHLVDLAGSEHAGKTGNVGTRLKESAYINTGLLALGKVIRALTDHTRNRGNNGSSVHIPYRDAKITRLLRDSLGGTAHTLMVACVSPSHHFDAETLKVLQFASKARHIRNCPGAINTHAEVKCPPSTWHPDEARLGELEHEVQTLRELLKEKVKDTETGTEKKGARGGEGGHFKQSSHIQLSEPEKVNQDEMWQYCLLAQEAAALLSDVSSLSPSLSLRHRVQDWHEKLTAVDQSSQTHDKDYAEGRRDPSHHVTVSNLREALQKSQVILKSRDFSDDYFITQVIEICENFQVKERM